jgi:hypothetical protein
MLAVFREICAIEENDGVIFDVDALRVELIREELEYGGLRLRTTARLAGARITVVIDIGFGDAIEPGIEEINLPVLLDLPAPWLRAYARETVVNDLADFLMPYAQQARQQSGATDRGTS